ncbi:P-loop containing nucleoside triphosphate hydrolase protein [Xylaria castorea]|nr:P-loop containing nucleoside triphosphate hydrolase protein [Xylaria castorea]
MAPVEELGDEHSRHTDGCSEKSGEVHTEISELTESKVSIDPEEGSSQTKSSEVPVTMRCEVKYLERRYDDRDEPFFKESGREAKKHRQMDWWRHFAICIVECFDHSGRPERSQMHVNSPALRSLLHHTLNDCIDDCALEIPSPYWPLFHHYTQLEELGYQLFEDHEEGTAHLLLLLDWIRAHFKTEFIAHEACIKSTNAIYYDYLWTVFPPKSIVYNKRFGKHRAFRYVDFDGEKMGEIGMNLLIPKNAVTNELRLCDMVVKPLDWVEHADIIRTVLIQQGKIFETFIGQHYGQYNGIAQHGYDQLSVEGRIMIDCKTYRRLKPNNKIRIEEALISFTQEADGSHSASDRLSDEHALITNSTVRGFSFTANRFLKFFVENIQPIRRDLHSFDELKVEPLIKNTLQGVVSHHAKNRNGISYVESGKGQGLVCLLHGPHGVGKTLTAKCVADHVQRPLYTVSSGDLGTTRDALEKSLSRIIDLASTWKAVLLIDDVDVFVEPHTSLDFQRNAMISVFLRMLDNYTGILFLTTTRVNAIDSAFMSRIHIPIHYTELSLYKRLELWRNFLSPMADDEDIDEEQLLPLAAHNFNGRQIKNIVKVADALAESGTVSEDSEDSDTLQAAANIHVLFEQNLAREAYSRGRVG